VAVEPEVVEECLVSFLGSPAVAVFAVVAEFAVLPPAELVVEELLVCSQQQVLEPQVSVVE